MSREGLEWRFCPTHLVQRLLGPDSPLGVLGVLAARSHTPKCTHDHGVHWVGVLRFLGPLTVESEGLQRRIKVEQIVNYKQQHDEVRRRYKPDDDLNAEKKEPLISCGAKRSDGVRLQQLPTPRPARSGLASSSVGCSSHE